MEKEKKLTKKQRRAVALYEEKKRLSESGNLTALAAVVQIEAQRGTRAIPRSEAPRAPLAPEVTAKIIAPPPPPVPKPVESNIVHVVAEEEEKPQLVAATKPEALQTTTLAAVDNVMDETIAMTKQKAPVVGYIDKSGATGLAPFNGDGRVPAHCLPDHVERPKPTMMARFKKFLSETFNRTCF